MIISFFLEFDPPVGSVFPRDLGIGPIGWQLCCILASQQGTKKVLKGVGPGRNGYVSLCCLNEAEVWGSFEPRRLKWAMIVPLHSSLGDGRGRGKGRGREREGWGTSKIVSMDSRAGNVTTWTHLTWCLVSKGNSNVKADPIQSLWWVGIIRMSY